MNWFWLLFHVFSQSGKNTTAKETKTFLEPTLTNFLMNNCEWFSMLYECMFTIFGSKIWLFLSLHQPFDGLKNHLIVVGIRLCPGSMRFRRFLIRNDRENEFSIGLIFINHLIVRVDLFVHIIYHSQSLHFYNLCTFINNNISRVNS